MARGDDLELERELARRLPPPRPRTDFRAGLRARFAASKETDRGGSPGPYAARTPPSSMLEDHLRNLPLAEPARPEFREALAERFVAGRLASGDPVARAQRDTPFLASSRSSRRPLSSGPLSWQVGLGLVAAAAAVAWLVIGTGQGPAKAPSEARRAWSVRGGGRTFELDDQRIATADFDSARMARLLGAANCVGCYEEGLELVLGDDVRLQLGPFSRLHLPKDRVPSDRTGGDGVQSDRTRDEGTQGSTRELEFVLDRGAVQLERKPGCASTLVVSTPHAQVRVVGTVLSIEVVEGEGTCICVAKGRAEVLVLSGENQRVLVEDDRTCFVFGDARAPKQGPTSDMVPHEHAAVLRKFCEKQY